MPRHARAALAGGLLLTYSGLALPTASHAQSTLAPATQAATAKTKADAKQQAKPEPPPTAGARREPRSAGARQAAVEVERKAKLNAWTIGLAAGQLEGAPLQFATELARVLDDGDEMRVLPMVTRGPFDNIYDLLYLRGVDAAIVYGDILDHFKGNQEIPGINRRINYLMSLFPSELHVLVRPEISTLADLAGKPVNFNTKGTAAAYSGPIIFKQLGIEPKATFIPHNVAMEKMKAGDDYAAVVFVSAKPLAPFLKSKFPPGFKFLPVPYTEKLEYYVPALLEHADYPALIPEGQSIATISVPAVLAVYDWPQETDRWRRLVRFVDYLTQRLERLQKEPGYHPKWKDVSLAAAVPGWQRFKPLQDRLDQRGGPATPTAATPRLDPAFARAQAVKAAPANPAEQERLFREFMDWTRKQGTTKP